MSGENTTILTDKSWLRDLFPINQTLITTYLRIVGPCHIGIYIALAYYNEYFDKTPLIDAAEMLAIPEDDLRESFERLEEVNLCTLHRFDDGGFTFRLETADPENIPQHKLDEAPHISDTNTILKSMNEEKQRNDQIEEEIRRGKNEEKKQNRNRGSKRKHRK